jgi:hypothetical protein
MLQAMALVLKVPKHDRLKKALYRAVADGPFERLGHRREDVGINLVEVKKENCSWEWRGSVRPMTASPIGACEDSMVYLRR